MGFANRRLAVRMIAPMQVEFHGSDPRWFEEVLAVARLLRRAGGRTHLVGGCVRDALLERPISDFDLEVFELAPSAVREALERKYQLDLVGMSFGVLKLRGLPIDIALPRRESKRGLGHRGFEVSSVPDLSERDAAARRDFTINAIAFDPLEGRWIDPFEGIRDLHARRLRHTSDHFVEDPLRVLRGAQFVARLDLQADPETVALCRTMGLEGLAVDRIEGEWRKLLLSARPGRGLLFIEEVDWLRFFPELSALRGCRQDPEWHPEGDVLDHTAAVLDAFAGLRLVDRGIAGDSDGEDWVVGLGCLCHDLGKPATTSFTQGRWRSPGHEAAGAEPTASLLGRLSRVSGLVDSVVPLVEHHLKPRQLYQAKAGDAAIRRLARKVRIDRLVRVAQADFMGRPPRPAEADPACDWLLERARALELEDAAPRPLVMGRHLLERGLAPGPHFRAILDSCFERQLDGEFDDLAGAASVLDEVLEQTACGEGAKDECR